MFRSHLISLVVFAAIVSVLLACLKEETKRGMIRYAIRNFLYMTGGVVLAGWLIRWI